MFTGYIIMYMVRVENVVVNGLQFDTKNILYAYSIAEIITLLF